MKKRLICLLLCGLLLTGLCSCGKTTVAPVQPSASDTTDSNNSPQKDDQDTPTQETTEPALPVVDATTLHAEIARDSKIKIKRANWDTTSFRLGNVKYSLPFSFARIQDDWTYDPSDYGFPDGISLGPKERTTDTLELEHDKMNCIFKVGLLNPSEATITPDLSQVWAVSVSIKDANTYPSLLLPGGLTWGSKLVDVVLAYGTPDIPVTHDRANHTWTYRYKEDYSIYYSLVISEDDGLIEFSFSKN